MRDRNKIVRAGLIVWMFALLAAPAVLAYEGQIAGTVTVTTGVAVVKCDDIVQFTATVLEASTDDPIDDQTVTWEITTSQSPNDRLNKTTSKTSVDGQTTVKLNMGETPGSRVVKATADGVDGTATVTCSVDSLPPTSASPPSNTPALAMGAAIAAVLAGFGILGFRFIRR